MSVDDQLRGGTLSEERLAALEQSLAGLPALEQRVGALEDNATGDGAAFPAQYSITNEGDVKSTYNETVNEQVVNEVVNEALAAEGDLIQGGKGKAQTLHRGKAGQVLKVGAGGLLEWANATIQRLIGGLVSPEGAILNGTGFAITHSKTGHYVVHFTEAFAVEPIFFAFAAGKAFDPAPAVLINGEGGKAAASVRTWENVMEGFALEDPKFADAAFYFAALEL